VTAAASLSPVALVVGPPPPPLPPPEAASTRTVPDCAWPWTVQ
jgi:hypothetical protein